MTKRINPTINALSTIVIVVIVLVLLFGKSDHAEASGLHREKNWSEKKEGSLRLSQLLRLFWYWEKWTIVSQGNHVLRVYNAGEYMDLSLLDKFEKQYNCTVVYETFESNEMMYTKLAKW